MKRHGSLCRHCFEPVAYRRGVVVDPETHEPHRCVENVAPMGGAGGLSEGTFGVAADREGGARFQVGVRSPSGDPS